VVLGVCGVWGDGDDLCNFQQGSFYSRRDVILCFQSIPLTESVRLQTIATLKQIAPLYTFLDQAQQSPDLNLPLSVDLIQGLTTIATTPYTSAFAFHDALRALYTTLNDAHTQYYSPSCFQQFLIRHPIPPISYSLLPNNTNIIAVSRYMSSDLVEYVFEKEGIDIRQLIGAEIVQVDGVSAFEYFRGYSEKNIGMAKDPGTRFHLAMTQPQPQPNFDLAASSYWQVRTKRNPFPSSEDVLMKFRFPNGTVTSLRLPWTYKAQKTYTGYDSFYADYVAATTSEMRNVKGSNDPSPSVVSLEAIEHIIPSQHRTKDNNALFYSLGNTTDSYFWALNDNKTMVMYFSTMAPQSDIATYKAMDQAVTLAHKMGLTQLVIDLTNNGGGDICFGQSLLGFFQGYRPGYQIWAPQDVPLSPLQDNLTKTSIEMNVSDNVWAPGFYNDEDGNHVANDDITIFEPGVSHPRGKMSRSYSNLVHIHECYYEYFFKAPQVFSASNILILTHGFCGSTCAMTANHAAEYDGVRTIVAGGIQSRSQQQYTSFPGGQVMEAADFFDLFDQLGGNTTPGWPAPGDVIPRRLPTTANFRYCVRELYPPSIVADTNSPPLEFSFQPATYKISDTLETAEDPELLWYSVLPLFGQN